MADDYRYAYIHEDCDKVAFYYDHLPAPGETVEAKHALLLSGEKPVTDTDCICGYCGERLFSPLSTNRIHKRW